MSDVSVKGEQSTSVEVETLANLTALETSPSGEFVRKTSTTTFENAAPAGDGTSTAVQKFTTTGGSEVITLDNTPSVIIGVIVNGQDLSDEAGDYSISGANITILNPNTLADLFGRVVYAY